MNNTERDLRRRLKKSIRKRNELNNRWNKLKKYLINEQEISISFQEQMGNYVIVKPKLYIETILNKIQELESGDSNG